MVGSEGEKSMKTFKIDRKMTNIITSQIVDEQNLLDYIHRQIDKKNYSRYLNKIIINNNGTYFSQTHKNLFIDFEQLQEEGNQLFTESFLTRDKDLFINIWLLIIVIHEMEHIKHRSFFYGGAKNKLEEYICREINFSTTEIPSDDYDKYHDYFLYERLATFSSFGSIFDLFSKVDFDRNLCDCFFQYMLYYLEIGYEKSNDVVKSPLETVFELMKIEKDEIKKLMIQKNMSILEKAEFGFPLKLKQYNKVKTKYIVNVKKRFF